MGGQRPALAVTWVHGDYFSTFGIPLVRGRRFSMDEQRSNRGVAIVSARLAERYWPGEDPIGRRFKWGLKDSPAPWQVIIGVAGDVVDGPPGSEPPTHIYVPYSEISDEQLAAPTAGLLRRFVVAVRAETNPRALAGTVRGAVAALDPALATAQVRPFTELRHDRVAPQRFSTIVLGAFAAGALLLAAIGLYGTLAFSISQRRREIGVRVALGAQRRDVLRSVVGRGMTLVAGGLVLGALGALAATRLLAAVLFDTRPHDPLVFGGVLILLGVVALIACYLPARRAADVDPLIAMRVD
jgi:predicted permease